MATGKRRWPLVVAGIAVVVVVCGVAVVVVGTMLFRENVAVTRGTTRDSAESAFATQKAKFADPRPLLLLDDDDQPVMAPGHDARKNLGTVSAVHVLVFDADDGTLATVTLPMWLLRMKSGPIVFGDEVAGMGRRRLPLEPADIERYGPGVVLELDKPGGDHVLITAQ